MSGWRSWRVVGAAVVIAAAIAVLGAGLAPYTADANPHAGQSVDVAMIGSPGVINGGTLVVTGPAGGLGDFTFTNLAPANVSTANLAAFDTAVLNVASSQMGCNVGTLSAPAKTDLAAFVSSGGKLIIYDSECSQQDYSWLPYPFTTNNPGAFGASGTLTIAEENILASASASSPHFIDAASLGSDTDAVGDMNVMTTLDSNWCLSMSGTNANDVTGPVHAYARYGSGLIIYNGLDVDYMGGEPTPPYPNGLQKIWLQELQAPLHPSTLELPCGILVIGTATPTVPSGAQPTPCIGGIVSSRCPGNPPEVQVTVTPEATATSAPPTQAPPTAAPPQPTATQPGGGAAGFIIGPNTGSGPGEAGASTGWLMGLAVLLATGAVAASFAAVTTRGR
ncbi:MAG: hypothetical protein EPO22_03270 [Dehalococcoidia bacterium]|nr:MAG: hypothetical protein EPO22_03270 [Dehalococcoidia bacterium]